MVSPICRACRARAGDLALDLGEQPACDYFPACDDPGPDPVYPLQMWLCSRCALAQLVADPTVPEEARGTEPAALVAQAADAVSRVAAVGLLPRGGRVAEYGSPHGGSWLGLLAGCGLDPVPDGEPADVVVDSFGLMHAADQSAAIAERAARVAPGGALLLQYHSLGTIIRRGQWNVLRHGHYAYYSCAALEGMLAANGFSTRLAWQFDLYGGTVLLAAMRDADGGTGRSPEVDALLADDARTGVHDPAVLRGLASNARAHSGRLRAWLVEHRSAGLTVLGYGAASRAVALMRLARVDTTLLPAVVDSSPAKHGLRMPGTDIPIVGPSELAIRKPDAVLVFVTDLMAEIRAAYPQVEASGGQWTDADSLGTGADQGSGALQVPAQSFQAPATSGADAADRQP